MNKESKNIAKKKDILINEISPIFEGPIREIELDRAMQIVGETMDSDRAYVFLFRNDGDHSARYIENLQEWCAEGIENGCNIMLDVDSNDISWWFSMLSRNKTINYSDINSLPMDAIAERSLFQAQDVKSIIAAPIISLNDYLLGFVAVDTINGEHEWGPKDESFLISFSNIIRDYLRKKKAELEMMRANRIINCTWKKKKRSTS